jgi:hypothetical protein
MSSPRTFLSLPGLVIGSNRIATMHRRLANRLASYLPLTIREVPLDIPPIREAIQWHISHNNDPAIRWIVEKLVAAAAQKPTLEDNKIVSMDKARARGPSHEELSAQFQAQHNSGGDRALFIQPVSNESRALSIALRCACTQPSKVRACPHQTHTQRG